MLISRLILAVALALLVQNAPEQAAAAAPSKPALFSVEMRTFSNWSRRSGHAFDYRVTLVNVRDGSCSFSGSRKPGEWGDYIAKCPRLTFTRLADFIEALKPSEFEQWYGDIRIADAEYCQLLIKYESNDLVQITDYAGGGPPLLWGLEQAIRATTDQLEWALVPSEPPR